MQIELERSLENWARAELVTAEQAARIHEFETTRVPPQRARLPIVLGLALGGIMLASGILLFVAAHWADLSPVQRMALLVFALGSFHLGGAFSASRFHAMAVTLHAAGTVALGGAILLAAQIFNMQEHWPTGILLWALGAVAGYGLLGQWPQLAMAAILVPFWLIGEWAEAASGTMDAFPVAAAGCILLAICYLSARTPVAIVRDPQVSRTLAWIGGIALLPSVFAMAAWNWWGGTRTTTITPLEWAGWAGTTLIPLAFAYAFRKTAAWINVIAAGWVLGLAWLSIQHHHIALYAWCAVGSAGMIAWGILELRPERVNLGMAGFALTVVFFFFSNAMDKLGRSTSLIVLGAALLAGGWYWEQLRRKLVARTIAGGVA
jgi:hypothetical protein